MKNCAKINRIIVRVEEAKHRQFKAACATNGTTMSAVLRRAIEATIAGKGDGAEEQAHLDEANLRLSNQRGARDG